MYLLHSCMHFLNQNTHKNKIVHIFSINAFILAMDKFFRHTRTMEIIERKRFFFFFLCIYLLIESFSNTEINC